MPLTMPKKTKADSRTVDSPEVRQAEGISALVGRAATL
jgi:hypothetical protein